VTQVEIGQRVAVICGALFVASALVMVVGERFRQRKPGQPGPLYMLLSTLGFVAALFGSAYAGTPFLAALVGGVGFLCSLEVLRVLKVGPKARVLGAGAALFGVVATALGQFPLGMVALALTTLVAALMWRGHARSLFLAAVYPGAGLVHLVALGATENGFGHLVFLYAVIELGDSAAWLAGSYLGGPKVWPRLSPNKTWAGSVGGLLGALGGGLVFAFAVPGRSLTYVVTAALLLGVAGQAGDLAGSAIKRRAGVKDFGTLLPHHGGALDVWDALLFCSPVYFWSLAAWPAA
jgi:phosphatidate cytidylyltransferase